MRSFWATFQIKLQCLAHHVRQERGQSMAEYAILIGAIAMAVVAAAVLLGHNISTPFNSVAGHV
jgi:Flp pilus assembly pilin Flp